MKTTQDNAREGMRREFAFGGLAVFASLLLAFNPFKSSAKKTKVIKQPVKLLAEDGKLMEVDARFIASQGERKISDEELRDWVKTK